MFVRSSALVLGSLLCASLLPSAAQAQAEPKGFYATIYGQYSRIGSSNLTESGAQGNHSLDTLRAGNTTLARDGDFASNIFLINGLRRFPSGGAWTPYVGAGIGWVQEIDIDIKPSAGGATRGYSAGSEFAYQLIAGVEYALSPQWRLTADTRWLRVGSVRLDNEVANAGGTAGPLTYNPFSVQVGVRYSF